MLAHLWEHERERQKANASYLYRERLCRPCKVGKADVGQLVRQGATI